MAQNIFKGFKQEVENQFTAETGYLYFVRYEDRDDKDDGYILFNGKMYGTGNKISDALDEFINFIQGVIGDTSQIPEGDTIISWLEGINNNVNILGEGLEELMGEVTSAETRITELEAISADTRIAELKNEIGELPSGTSSVSDWISENERVISEALVSLDSRVSANTSNIATLSGISADTRLTALEALSGESHTHENKSVLDGISAEDVAAWDAAENNAIAAASAYTDSKYDSAITASEVVLSALTGESATSGYLKSYELFQGGTSLGKIDIPKDMVVSSGTVVEEGGVKYLRLFIANTDPQQHVDIAVADLAHVYTQGSGITITNTDEIQAKIVAANGLSLDGDGIKMSLADASNNGAMSAADFEKLSGIASGAQVNVIENIKVNGTDLTVTDKEVNIELPSAEVSGLSNGTSVKVTQVSGEVTTVEVVAPDFGTLSGRVDALEAISADTRLNVLETSAATKEEVGTLSGRVDTLSAVTSAHTEFITNSAATKEEVGTLSGRVDTVETNLGTVSGRVDVLEAVSAGTRIAELEAVSADTRLDALEALTGTTSSALQEVVNPSGDTSITIGAKDANNEQTIAVNISADANNAISLSQTDGGLFAAIYYEDDDPVEP